jgi:hypothetical protein
MNSKEHTMQTQDILEAIDTKLDEVDELIMELPLPDSIKRKLCENLYTLWEQVEAEMDLKSTDFG